MMRTLVALAALVGFVGWTSVAAAQAKPDNVGEFMQAKLVHAQKVLEALAVEDYQALAKHSQEISLLSQAASWQVLQTPEYREHSADFRRAVDAVTEAAKKQNLDGAALAYVETTLKCVNCHKYVRRVRMAQAGPPPLQPPAALAGARP